MRVIPTELLKQALFEAVIEEDGNFKTDVNRVINFVELMDKHSGFDVVKCRECKHLYKDECSYLCALTGDLRKQDWFCADGERKG